MAWDTNLTNLRDVLAGLYLTVQDAVRVVQDARLDPSYIAFDNKAINNWHNILSEADKRNKVPAIIEIARKQYPENELLVMAQNNTLTAVRGPDIADKVTWQGDQDVSHLERIIGEQSTLLPISFLEIGLQKSRSVVRVLRGDKTSGSGFLADRNLLITNNHVLASAEEAVQATVQFNYQKTPAGLDMAIAEFKLDPGAGFATSKDDDWTAVRFQGEPGPEWGSLALMPANVVKDQRVIIIQHPGGGPKHVALYHNVVAYADKKRVQYLTDTLPGSSGSPVFSNEWQVVALHHSGGYLPDPGSKQRYLRNEGILIDVVIDGLAAAGLA